MPMLEEMQSLTQEIINSYEARVAGVASLREGVAVQLGELASAHKAMGQQLRADLAKVRPALAEQDRKRESDAREFKGELAKAVADGKAAVKAQLEEFDRNHAVMSRELKADLAKIRPALEEEDKKRQSEAREFMGELGRTVAEGKAATQALLRDFGEVQAGARDEWQKMTATLQTKRGATAVEVKPLEVPSERERVFAYLANHPDGTRMTELEREFGEYRIQMAKILKTLMDENKVNKQDLLYFAI